MIIQNSTWKKDGVTFMHEGPDDDGVEHIYVSGDGPEEHASIEWASETGTWSGRDEAPIDGKRLAVIEEVYNSWE